MADYSSIPAELKALRQWVAWNPNDPRTREADGTEGRKVPLNPKTLRNASSTDPETWGTFEEAVSTGYGIGFVLTADDPYLCVDLDHVANEGGIEPEALEIVERLDTYTEFSPSGTGLHLWCRAVKPGDRSRAGIVEMYDSGRYIRFTGDVYGDRNTLRNAQNAVYGLYSDYMGMDNQTTVNAPYTASQSLGDVPADVQTVIERAERSVNGGRFSALMRGDTSAYGGDRSRADLALCSMAAFFAGGDRELTDAVMRSSALMRDKWDEKRGEMTYGEITVNRALEQQGYYSVDHTAPAGVQVAKAPEVQTLSDYMSVAFAEDVRRFSGYDPKSTGFRKLDRQARGLYPGLYVIGALSSLGKTTFALNICDNLASAGTPVLFFSFEQSRFELLSKLIAKRTYDPIGGTGIDALSVRAGSHDRRVEWAKADVLTTCGPNLTIVECSFDADVRTIRDAVERFIADTGRAPVVFVDYLQIIKPLNDRMTERQAVDQNVHALKKLQAEHDLTVIVISSVNRNNYLSPMSFESFKESGGIEYTADVVWGLQFSCLGEKLFEEEKKAVEKRKRIEEARAESPRKIDLICLKNRYGRPFYTVSFSYAPEYDVFCEV